MATITRRDWHFMVLATLAPLRPPEAFSAPQISEFSMALNAISSSHKISQDKALTEAVLSGLIAAPPSSKTSGSLSGLLQAGGLERLKSLTTPSSNDLFGMDADKISSLIGKGLETAGAAASLLNPAAGVALTIGGMWTEPFLGYVSTMSSRTTYNVIVKVGADAGKPLVPGFILFEQALVDVGNTHLNGLLRVWVPTGTAIPVPYAYGGFNPYPFETVLKKVYALLRIHTDIPRIQKDLFDSLAQVLNSNPSVVNAFEKAGSIAQLLGAIAHWRRASPQEELNVILDMRNMPGLASRSKLDASLRQLLSADGLKSFDINSEPIESFLVRTLEARVDATIANILTEADKSSTIKGPFVLYERTRQVFAFFKSSGIPSQPT